MWLSQAHLQKATGAGGWPKQQNDDQNNKKIPNWQFLQHSLKHSWPPQQLKQHSFSWLEAVHMVEPVWLSALSQTLVCFPTLCITCMSGALSIVAVPLTWVKIVDRVTEKACSLELAVICYTMQVLHEPCTPACLLETELLVQTEYRLL